MFALCKLLPMTDDTRERFIRNQLAGLKALGLDDDALTREENLLRAGFAQSESLSRLFALSGETSAPRARQISLEGGDSSGLKLPLHAPPRGREVFYHEHAQRPADRPRTSRPGDLFPALDGFRARIRDARLLSALMEEDFRLLLDALDDHARHTRPRG